MSATTSGGGKRAKADASAAPAEVRSGMPEPHVSLYPERERINCKRCQCEHFKGGRCFRDDEVGWPIVAKELSVKEERRRHPSMEGPAITAKPVPRGKAPEGAWWTR